MTERIERAFQPPKDAIDWADTDIRQLHSEIAEFFNAGAAPIIIEVDPDTGVHVQKIILEQPISSQIRRFATGALQHLRNAFDQAAFSANTLVSGPNSEKLYYPWADNLRDMDYRMRKFDNRLWDTFQEHEPFPRGAGYSGGCDVCRTIATVANNKHTIGLTVDPHISRTQFPRFQGSGGGDFEIFTPKWDSVKNEAILAQWTGYVKSYGDYAVRFHIVFDDPRFAQPLDVVLGLQHFSARAKMVVETLQARCTELLT